MANATAITLRSLTAGTVLTAPTADVLDTGTTAVTLKVTPNGDSHRLLLEFTNTAQAADTMTVTINAGDNPPALSQALGAITFTVAQSAVRYIVVDSAQVMQNDGTIEVVITPASTKTQTATIRAYMLPK